MAMQVVHEDYHVLVAMSRDRQLQYVDAHTMEWSFHRI